MPFPANKTYGVLRANIKVDEKESTSKKSGMSHYNLICEVPAEDNKEYQVNIDIQSSKSANVRMLVKRNFVTTNLPKKLTDIAQGFSTLPSKADTLALDLIHQPIFPIDELKDSKPISAEQITETLNNLLSVGNEVIVFGTLYDDDDHKHHEAYHHDDESYRDHHMYGARRHREQKLPPRGVDDVHLNQGTPSTQYQHKDNGVYQDGALFIVNTEGGYNAIFFAFATQCFDTNDQGNCPPPAFVHSSQKQEG